MKTLAFTVDAALLRELGERLIGQPHIALGELVKNAFDADASTCRIIFGPDKIEILDDGKGMSFEDFRDFWMRIGTTHKIDQKFSERLKRPLTGSKGVGRLAVQFLADEMTIESTSERGEKKMLVAIVDWTNAVRGNTLSSVPVEYEVVANQPQYPNKSAHGTRIVLTRLKNDWEVEHLRKLGKEIWMLRSPFRRRAKGPETRGSEDFEVEIEAPDIQAAHEEFDGVLKRLLNSWRARIRGTLENGRAGASATVILDFAPDSSSDSKETFRERIHLPVQKDELDLGTGGSEDCLVDKASFEILIFKIEGKQAEGVHVGDLRTYLQEYGNVSIYDSGFRLPYYGAKHDWLDITLDQSRRISISQLLPPHLRIDERYMLDLPAPARIFGAVNINTGHELSTAVLNKAAPGNWLQIQPGRDRLHDNPAFGQLRDFVRFSLDFYANRYRAREARVAERLRSKESATIKQERALSVLDRNKNSIPNTVYREVKHEVSEALKASKKEEIAIDKRAALFAPLASAGMIALALNHELSREARFLQRVSVELRRIAKKHSLNELTEIAKDFEDARIRLASLQELFAPMLSEEDSAGYDRLRVRAVAEQAISGMRVLMPNVEFQLKAIPADLRFPAGSLAEWNALLQNVFSNSWNAMLDSSLARIRLSGGHGTRNREWLRISDTGQGLNIPLEESDKLFEPFERKIKIAPDKKSIAIGGQGLGLAIVQMISKQRGAEVTFVEPEDGYSTTVELSWRG